MSRKFVFYLNDNSRGIVITDDDDEKTNDEYSKNISKLMSGFEIAEFRTASDCLIVRPNNIKAVHIQGGKFGGAIEDLDLSIEEDEDTTVVDPPRHAELNLDIDLSVDEEEAIVEIEEDLPISEPIDGDESTDIERQVAEWHSEVGGPDVDSPDNKS